MPDRLKPLLKIPFSTHSGFDDHEKVYPGVPMLAGVLGFQSRLLCFRGMLN